MLLRVEDNDIQEMPLILLDTNYGSDSFVIKDLLDVNDLHFVG